MSAPAWADIQAEVRDQKRPHIKALTAFLVVLRDDLTVEIVRNPDLPEHVTVRRPALPFDFEVAALRLSKET